MPKGRRYLRARSTSTPGIRVCIVHPGTQHALHEAGGFVALGMPVSVMSRAIVSRTEATNVVGRMITERYPVRLVPDPRILVRRLKSQDELVALAAIRTLDYQHVWAVYARLNRRFGRAAAASLLLDPPDVVIGFDSACLQMFQLLQGNAPEVLRVLEATIVEPRRLAALLLEAADRYPAWRRTIDVSLRETEAETVAEEVRLADLVVAGSAFAATSYGEQSANVIVNPYATDFTPSRGLPASERRGYLFCGSPILRKGLPDLLDVAHRLPASDPLHVVGTPPDRTLLREFKIDRQVRFHGRLRPEEVRSMMGSVRATVLPTYGEGLSRVLGEALSQGSPIVTTPNSGIESLTDANPEIGPSVAIVQAGAPEQLLETLLSNSLPPVNPKALRPWSWRDYAARIVAAVEERIDK